MAGLKLRPWGLLNWLLSKIPDLEWSILGCLSTEERCLATLDYMSSRGAIKTNVFLQVLDQDVIYSDISEKLYNARLKDFIKITGTDECIEKHTLFEKTYILHNTIKKYIDKSDGNIIVDISSFPKRYFFPIIRWMLLSADVHNLLVTYTVPFKYCQGPLAEDPQQWLHIPTFGPTGYPSSDVEVAFIGVGFLPFGLPELLKMIIAMLPSNFSFLFHQVHLTIREHGSLFIKLSNITL